jgi:hypothetical protein
LGWLSTYHWYVCAGVGAALSGEGGGGPMLARYPGASE